jgi:hypothetical protein
MPLHGILVHCNYCLSELNYERIVHLALSLIGSPEFLEIASWFCTQGLFRSLVSVPVQRGNMVLIKFISATYVNSAFTRHVVPSMRGCA